MSYRVQEIDADYLKRQEKRDKANLKYPKCFKTEVNLSKVNLPIVKTWITTKINEQLPDDDIVIDYLYELLVASEDHPDIRSIQVQMNDFLGESESRTFCEKLWKLLISAQNDPDGIPEEVLEQRRKEAADLEKNRTVHTKDETRSNQKTNYNRSSYNANKRKPEGRNDRWRDTDRNRERDHKRVNRDRSPTRSVRDKKEL